MNSFKYVCNRLMMIFISAAMLFTIAMSGAVYAEPEKEDEGQPGDLYIEDLETVDTEFVNGYTAIRRIRVKAGIDEGSVSEDSERPVIEGYAVKGPLDERDEVQFDKSDFSEGSVFEIKENGDYCFGVRDSRGRTAAVFYQVSCIDRTAPVISGIESEARGAKSGYGRASVVSVYAYDTKSRLAPEAFSFDDGVSYGSDYRYEAKENGTLYIRVRDGLGNVARISYEVNDIDDRAPAIAVTGNRTETGSDDVILYVQASDEQSGIDSLWYTESETGEEVYLGYYENEKQVSAQAPIDKNGEYVFYCLDASGNESSATVRVTAIDRKKNSSSTVKSTSSGKKSGTTYSSRKAGSVVIGGTGSTFSRRSTGSTLVINDSDYRTSDDGFRDYGRYEGSYAGNTAAYVSKKEPAVTFYGDDDEEEEDVPEADDELWDEEWREAFDSVSEDYAPEPEGFYALEKEEITGVYEKRLAQNEPVTVSGEMAERTPVRSEGVGRGRIMAVGILITVLLLTILILCIRKLKGSDDEEEEEDPE